MSNDFEGLTRHIEQRYKDAMPRKKNNFNSLHDKDTWENDPVITDDEVKKRKALVDKAKAGCCEAIETLKQAPFSLKVLVLNGQKII